MNDSEISFLEDSDFDQNLSHSVVQIICPSQFPNIYNPEGPKNNVEQTVGSGVLIDLFQNHEPCVITCAHVVENAVHKDQIKIFVNGVEYQGCLYTLCPETDIAILKFFSEKNWPSPPLEIGNDKELVPLQILTVVGYELGGQIKHRSAKFNGWQDWRLQLDGAINQGDSGAPVFHKNKIIGWVTSGIPKANRISWANPICMLYTLQFENAPPLVQYQKQLPFQWQDISEDHIEFLNLSSKQGILICKEVRETNLQREEVRETNLQREEEPQYQLQQNEIILKVDGYPIEHGFVRVPWCPTFHFKNYCLHKNKIHIETNKNNVLDVNLVAPLKCHPNLDPPPFISFGGCIFMDYQSQPLFKNEIQNYEHPFITFVTQGCPLDKKIQPFTPICHMNQIEVHNIDQLQKAFTKPIEKHGKLFFVFMTFQMENQKKVFKEIIFRVSSLMIYESYQSKFKKSSNSLYLDLTKKCETGKCK